MRPNERFLTHNQVAMNHLALCPKKVEFQGPIRPRAHSALSLPRRSNKPHNPPRDANLSFPRHKHPFRTDNPLIMLNLSLCPQKRRISGLLRHQAPAPLRSPRHNGNEQRWSPILELNGFRRFVSRWKRREVRAVDQISLQVPRGTTYGFLGPNGAGKTTFVKMLLSAVHPTAGSARIFGRSAAEPDARRPIGYLPENHRFPTYFTGAAMLDFYASLSKLEPCALVRGSGSSSGGS